MNFKHKIVNDLAWVIGSAPLMALNSENEGYECVSTKWVEEEFSRCNAFLQAEDCDPKRLELFIEQKGSQLLGKRFERFVEYWLLYGDRFDLLVSNLPVRDKKITVGEIDYVVREKDTEELIHFEVACKYYLGFANSDNWVNWKGINANDRLADKMTKFDKQLNIFNTDLGRDILFDLKLGKPKSYLFMKGYFFYHWKNVVKAKSPQYSNASHHVGVYLSEVEISDFFSGKNSWVILKKHNWFSRYRNDCSENILSEYEVKTKIVDLIRAFGFGVMLARVSENSGKIEEELRVAVVLNSWS